MRTIPLVDLLTSAAAGYWGREPGGADVETRVVRNGDIKPRTGLVQSPLPIRSFTPREIDKARVRAGDVLITTSGDCGVTALVTDEPQELTCASNFVRILRSDRQKIEPGYLFHFLQSSHFLEALRPYIRGTTLQNLSTRDAFSAVRVPVPSLDEQRRIATILDQADALRAQRRQTLELLSRMRAALFHSRFESGDSPWPRVRLGELIRSSQLGLVRSAAQQGADLPHEYVKMDAITESGDLSLTSLARVAANSDELRRFTVSDGDLLFNTRNTRALVGKSTVYRGPPRLFNNNLMRLRFVDAVLADYVHGYLWSREGRRQLEARKSGTTSVFAVYAKNLATVRIPIPPLELQRQFASALDAVRSQYSRAAPHERALHDLLHSLRNGFSERRDVSRDNYDRAGN